MGLWLWIYFLARWKCRLKHGMETKRCTFFQKLVVVELICYLSPESKNRKSKLWVNYFRDWKHPYPGRNSVERPCETNPNGSTCSLTPVSFPADIGWGTIPYLSLALSSCSEREERIPLFQIRIVSQSGSVRCNGISCFLVFTPCLSLQACQIQGFPDDERWYKLQVEAVPIASLNITCPVALCDVHSQCASCSVRHYYWNLLSWQAV